MTRAAEGPAQSGRDEGARAGTSRGSEIRVLSPGPMCTIQDAGRFGFQRYGVSVSGAADGLALRLGNRLLGNRPGAAALEVTAGGFEAEFSLRAAVAITGGDLSASIEGVSMPMWTVLYVEPGQKLALPGPQPNQDQAGSGQRPGLRAYLCVAGGVDSPVQLGSRSTYVRGGLGGLRGEALAEGDVVPITQPETLPPLFRHVRDADSPAYQSRLEMRVVPGPQDHHFTAAGLDTFFGSDFTVTDRSDRQGVRLEGPEIEATALGYNIVSDAVVTGAVQVPGDRKPIILLADRQTTGGYPKIGVVIEPDLGLLAQAAPGTVVRFHRVSVEEAQEVLRDHGRRQQQMAFAEPRIRQMPVTIGGARYLVELPETEGMDAGSCVVRRQVRVNDSTYSVEVEQLESD